MKLFKKFTNEKLSLEKTALKNITGGNSNSRHEYERSYCQITERYMNDMDADYKLDN
ncbi:hypothetical protein [Aquimarina atlantica]|uniref:hypothetical protein n=1 Tax=Aquimarina atlantica TaxID=1317122 RepID=UPI000B028374|nr:hypothetical protein [Aquimarina atlantica]